MNRIWLAVWIAAVAPACGGSSSDDDDNDVVDIDGAGANADPMLIPGGGVRSGAIDGVLHVHAIDGDDDGAIAGATVYVSALTGTTEGSGLFTFRDASLSGAQTISVTAPGYATTTWIGANGTNVTIPMSASPRSIPKGRVSGTIAGWDGMNPAFGNYIIGLVLYSQSDRVTGPENSLEQTMSGDYPSNVCVKSILDDGPCNWQMNVRTGKQIHYAILAEGVPQGDSSDPFDDDFTLIGFAALADVNVSAGANLTGESLAMLTGGNTSVTVSIPGAPAGLNEALAVPSIRVPGSGRLLFPLPLVRAGATTTQVPSLSGPFASGSYDVLGFATPTFAAPTPYSSSFQRDVNVSQTVALSTWLAPPTGLSAAGGSFSFSGSGANMYAVSFIDAGQNPKWNVMIIDGTTSFGLPAQVPNAASGAAQMQAASIDWPGLNTGNFSLADFDGEVARAAGAATSVTP